MDPTRLSRSPFCRGSRGSIKSFAELSLTDGGADISFVSSGMNSGRPSIDQMHPPRLSNGVEAEMKRLKLELKQTMDMYTAACRESLTAKQTVKTCISQLPNTAK